MFGDLINIAIFKKDLKEVAKEVTLGSGFFNYLVVILVVGIVSLILSFLSILTSGIGGGTPIESAIMAVISTIASVIFAAIFIIPAILIISLIYFAIVNIFAKMLGGKGNFAKTTGILWTVSAAVLLTYMLALQVITGVLQVILGFLGPLGGVILFGISILLMPVSIAIGVISLFLQSKAVGAVHNISTIRGFAALIIPVIVLSIILFVVALILMVILGAAFFSIVAPVISNPTGYFGLM